MTQRVARPMKFAAFISIIISVAVLFAACAGPAGTPGADGADGADGATGATGGTGDPGKSPLYATAGIAAILLYANDGETDSSVGDPATATLSEHFGGGLGTVTVGELTALTDKDIAEAARNFTAELADGIATFAVQMNDANPPLPVLTDDYDTRTYTLEITDSAGPSLTLTFNVRRNQPPGDSVVSVFTIGTSDIKLESPRAPTSAVSCNPHNECTLTVVGMDSDTSDDLSYTATTESDALVVSSKDNKIVLVGRTSTENANDDDNDDAAEVKIITTDLGGLTSETTVAVTVDGAPTGTIPAQSIKYSATVQVLITNLDAFFTDPDGDDSLLTYKVKPDSVDAQVAAVRLGTDDPPTLSVLAAVATGGTTQVTIVASEVAGLQQSGEATFTLTVNP